MHIQYICSQRASARIDYCQTLLSVTGDDLGRPQNVAAKQPDFYASEFKDALVILRHYIKKFKKAEEIMVQWSTYIARAARMSRPDTPVFDLLTGNKILTRAEQEEKRIQDMVTNTI